MGVVGIAPGFVYLPFSLLKNQKNAPSRRDSGSDLVGTLSPRYHPKKQMPFLGDPGSAGLITIAPTARTAFVHHEVCGSHPHRKERGRMGHSPLWDGLDFGILWVDPPISNFGGAILQMGERMAE